ncbi:MAG: SDR family oxidoreductase [Bacteriovoracaceae bacterium]
MKEILLTGATGYIGHNVATRLLANPDVTMNLWLNAKDETEFNAKKDKMLSSFSGLEKRIKFSWGTLSEEKPFKNVDWSTVTSVIHNAALTNFNVKEVDANAVNRDGTIKIIEAARTAPKLEKFTYISTVYASGLRPGDVPEEFMTNEHGFSNHYERSKWECEEYIRTKCQDMPWEIIRVATIICHDESGTVIQHNAVHNTLKLLYYGLISLMPGFAKTPVYLVTGEEVARSIAQIHKSAPVKKIFNVTHSQDASLTLGALVDLGFNTFNEDANFKARRILKPLFTDEKAFNALVSSVQGFGGQVLAQAVTSIAPFGRQLYITKNMINTNVKNHDPSFTDFDPAVVMKLTIQDMIKKGFKKV